MSTLPMHTQSPSLGDTHCQWGSDQHSPTCLIKPIPQEAAGGWESQLVSCAQLEDPNANFPITNSSATLPYPDTRR